MCQGFCARVSTSSVLRTTRTKFGRSRLRLPVNRLILDCVSGDGQIDIVVAVFQRYLVSRRVEPDEAAFGEYLGMSGKDRAHS